jgi:internalin A
MMPPLTDLTALQTLDLSGCQQLQMTLPLTDLTALQTVALYGCEHLKQVRPLTKLNALQILVLEDRKQLQVVSRWFFLLVSVSREDCFVARSV